MLKRILIGGAAGAVATIPMSGVIWGLKRAGLYKSKPAPEVISEETAKPVVHPSRIPGSVLSLLKTLQHVGFGAVGGALFTVTTGLVGPRMITGPLTGLGIWKASYDGWIPAIGILPPPEEDEQGRVVTMIAAHAVYGLTLGALMEWWLKRR